MSQGWYDDPSDPSRLRYWDGQQWSAETAPKGAPSSSPPAIQPPGGIASPISLAEQPTQLVQPGSGAGYRPEPNHQPAPTYQPAPSYQPAPNGQPPPAYQPAPGYQAPPANQAPPISQPPGGYQAPAGAGPAYRPAPGPPPGAGSPYQGNPGYQLANPGTARSGRLGLWLGVGAAAVVLLVIVGAVLSSRRADDTATGSTTTAAGATTTTSPGSTATTGATATTAAGGATTAAPPSTKVPASPVSAASGGKGAQAASSTAKKIIEGTLASRLGLGTITATCEVPANTNVGTTFTCTSPTKLGTVNWLATIQDGNIVDVMGQNVIAADDVPKYAAAAVDVLEKQVNQTLGIENFVCPPGPLVLKADNKFVCALTDPKNRSLVYDATITVTDISEGSFVVKVADQPR